ncbi:MAG: hypothetical protein O6852_05820 [Gammaproteobacteria bacterium]|nr:hypothetical protein [Gammaproteobacteria bacterium]
MNKRPHIIPLATQCFVSVVLVFIANSQLLAADMGGRYLVSGIGKDSCRSFVDADNVGRAYYLTWLSGYISSHNYHSQNTYSVINKKSVDDLETWLRSYCFANLDDTFEQAAKGLIRSLKYFKKKNFYDK